MINSVVFSKLFYCSAVWAGTYKQNIHKLQLMENFAARILTDTGKYDHITPALKALGWLTIEEQLWLRDVAVMYKCVNNLGTDHQKSIFLGGGEFSSRRNFFSLSNSLYEFFWGPQNEYFLGLIGVHEFFSFKFPLGEYFFCTSPAPYKFSNGPSLCASIYQL